MRRLTNHAVQTQKIAKVLKFCMSEVQGIYYLCCKKKSLISCSELFWHMQNTFPHDVAQMHHVQIRDLKT